MNSKMKKYTILGSLFIMLLVIGFTLRQVYSKRSSASLEREIEMTLQKSGVPDAQITIVNGEEISFQKFGKHKEEIDEHTLFEIGSMSKAFTGLAILKLEEEGMIHLDDPVTKYLPWLTFYYKGKIDGDEYDGEAPEKISNFLYQTSGIPYKTIGYIPIGNGEDSLEKTVRNLIDTKLDFYPGEQYQYTTINYDVLALIIQTVTGQSFEDYMQENIIDKLGLTNTYMGREKIPSDKRVIQGYKRIFFRSREYDAPDFRGNNGAGYIITCGNDMAKWMQWQLGIVDSDEQMKRLIQKSHIGDDTVDSFDQSRYAAGWQVHIRGENILHGGANPNYSSMIVMRPDDKYGVCVMTNMNSNASEFIADCVLREFDKESYHDYEKDTLLQADTFISILLILAVLLALMYFFLFVKAVYEVAKKTRMREKMENTKLVGLFSTTVILLFFLFSIYYLPNILVNRLPWSAVNIWVTPILQYGCIAIGAAGTLLILYAYVTFCFPKADEKNYFALIPLSIINGLGSAFIIFTINESFNRNLEYSKELLVFYLFALFIFIYTMKIVQGKLIVLANNLVYEKRVKIIKEIVQAPYELIEKIGQERIYVCLNNDTAAAANIPGIIVRFVSDVLTLLFCFGYLCNKNVYTFGASLGVIVINTAVSFLVSKISAKYWEKQRDMQDIFVNQISDLVYGFKEIVLNRKRCKEVEQELHDNSNRLAELSKSAEVKNLEFNMYNTFVYNFVFGVVVFIFPLILSIDVNELRESLLIIFYMIGPFGGLTYEISSIMQFRVNVKRVNGMIEELSQGEAKGSMSKEEKSELKCIDGLELRNVEYLYERKEGEEYSFRLGPINTKLKAASINFIIGGNGSGKSTLAKLLTGLYTPASGGIYVDGVQRSGSELNQYFSAVFSDFHLFKKLYGIDYASNKEQVDEILKKMKIDKKIQISEDGVIASLSLSTGQKKRLAYAILSVEDKPVVLFDEWAAEQDPEFREYFYETLIQELKQQGKCIIVITHDDRYFNCADNVIKLEEGKLTDYAQNS